MGAKISNATPPTDRSQKFQTFPEYSSLNGPYKTMFGIFETLKTETLTNFIHFH